MKTGFFTGKQKRMWKTWIRSRYLATIRFGLNKKSCRRITFHKGVHQALQDFWWLANDIAERPTRIAELIPLPPSALGDHDTSGQGAGGVWFPSATIAPRGAPTADPILWRLPWPKDIIDALITDSNPHGTLNNSDLELAGGLLHLDAAAQNYDIHERTVLSRTDNLATLFWQRNGSVTSSKAHAYLLRLFGIHQRYHCYVPARHNYLPGKSNNLADDSSRLFNLNNTDFLSHFNSTYPQNQSYKLWTPSKQVSGAVISALHRQMSKPGSALVEPLPPTPIGTNSSTTLSLWPSIPFSKPSQTKYQSYKSLGAEFEWESYQQALVPSSLGKLRSTYGRLDKHSSQWGKKIHA